MSHCEGLRAVCDVLSGFLMFFCDDFLTFLIFVKVAWFSSLFSFLESIHLIAYCCRLADVSLRAQTTAT